jgi:hypothetical protein
MKEIASKRTRGGDHVKADAEKFSTVLIDENHQIEHYGMGGKEFKDVRDKFNFLSAHSNPLFWHSDSNTFVPVRWAMTTFGWFDNRQLYEDLRERIRVKKLGVGTLTTLHQTWPKFRNI